MMISLTETLLDLIKPASDLLVPHATFSCSLHFLTCVSHLSLGFSRHPGGCIATVQALSGTGSLQCIAQFLKFMGVTKAGPMMSRAEIERDLFVNQRDVKPFEGFSISMSLIHRCI